MTPILMTRRLLSFFFGIIFLSSGVVYAQNEKMSISGDKEMKMSGDSHSMHTVNSFEPKDEIALQLLMFALFILCCSCAIFVG